MPTNSSPETRIAAPEASIVPVETPARSAAQPYGANNETLPERLQEALRRLVQQYSTESESTRRQEIRRIKQAHQFWRGLQYLWWDERDQNWHLPFEQKMMDNSSIEDLPRYEFVTNIYQAFGLSLIAVLSQDVRACASSLRPRRPKRTSPPRKPPPKCPRSSSATIASAT